MKTAVKLIALGVAFAASATLAKADSITGQISVQGADTFTQSAPYTITFPSGYPYAVQGTSTGTMAMFKAGTPVTWYNQDVPLPLGTPGIVNSPTGGTPLEIFSSSVTGMSGTTDLAFFLTDETFTITPQSIAGVTYQELNVSGDGFFTETGYSQTPATFNFTSQEVNGVTDINVSFSGTGTATGTPPVPEPSSLALLGTSLLGGAVLARRRFLSKVSS